MKIARMRRLLAMWIDPNIARVARAEIDGALAAAEALTQIAENHKNALGHAQDQIEELYEIAYEHIPEKRKAFWHTQLGLPVPGATYYPPTEDGEERLDRIIRVSEAGGLYK